VLPFVNMSGDPKQDYFSDGLSEELLNSLVSLRGLQVAARTSSFSFKGSGTDVADIARKLNVGAVLEGSVRKDGGRVRITAQLINAVTGFHLWSQTYDRDLKNVLALQTEIATAVTQALQATLLADASTVVELGGTHDPHAFDAYLSGRGIKVISKETNLAQIAAFDEAIQLDPMYAKAYASKGRSLGHYAGSYGAGARLEREGGATCAESCRGAPRFS
jgi:TolB-like protein